MESLLTKIYSPSASDNEAITNESNGKTVPQVTASIGAQKTNKPSSSSTEMAGMNDWERVEENMAITIEEPPTHREPPTSRSPDILVRNRSSGLAFHRQCRELLHEDKVSYETPNTPNSPVTDRQDSGAVQKGQSSGTEGEYGGQRSRVEEGQWSNVASEDNGRRSEVNMEENSELISHEELKSFELLDISEFESDSSDSLLEVAFPTSVSAATAAAKSTSSVPTAATEAGSSSAQFSQSELIVCR